MSNSYDFASVEEALSKEFVPAAPVVRALDGKFGWNETERREFERLQEQKYVSFNTADRLLCRAGIPWSLVSDAELAGLYSRVVLQDRPFQSGKGRRQGQSRVCSRPGCSQTFLVAGKPHKKYCKKSCSNFHWLQRHGYKRRTSEQLQYQCKHGHERSPENTITTKRGTRRCRICLRKWTREARARKRAARTTTPAPPRTPSSSTREDGTRSPRPNVEPAAERPPGATEREGERD